MTIFKKVKYSSIVEKMLCVLKYQIENSKHLIIKKYIKILIYFAMKTKYMKNFF